MLSTTTELTVWWLLSKLRHREVNDFPTEVEVARCLGRRDKSWSGARVQ